MDVVTYGRMSTMNAALAKESFVRWPTPPFFKLSAASPARHGGKCTVDLVDGRSIVGELVRFEPSADSIEVKRADLTEPYALRLQQIRSVRLSEPLMLLPDIAVLDALKTPVNRVGHDKPFIVQLRDGSNLTGTTRGFVKERSGLFLFVVEEVSALAFGCFIPTQQLKNVQIGPLLGETLVAKELVSRETLTAALGQQTQQRQERIGTYLTDRAVISAEDLVSALARQRHRPTMRLGEVLLEAKLISPEQLRQALEVQAAHRERRLGDILIDMGAVSARLIQMALSDKLGIPYVNVQQFKVEPQTLGLVEAAFAIRNQVLPLVRTSDSLVIAVENPLAIEFSQDLRFTSGLDIVAVLADPDELKARIAKEYSRLEGRGTDFLPSSGVAVSARSDLSRVEDLTDQLSRETQRAVGSAKPRETDTRVTDNTLVRLINKIIVEAHQQGASDIHIESNPGNSHTRIRFRKDGDLEDYLDLPPAYRSSLVSRIKVMADLDISEHRRPQDGKIDFGKFGPLPIELRVAIIPTANNLEDMVLRILGGMKPQPLQNLGFSVRDLTELKRMIARSYGLILVCGPTGSGKTTTLHSVLHDINRPDIKIWTAEDPIEITQPGLRQVQVHPKIDWTFAAAMRAFLRADPDVIMVGEMRDAETTKIGIEASLTGHLVFSTLHTNSAAESVVRLLDLGMDPFNFADALIGILSQRLARTLCPKCKQSHLATEAQISDLVEEYCSDTKLDPAAVLTRWRASFVDGLKLYEAVGCKDCRNGYKGRLGVYELLVNTPQLKHLIRTRATVPQLVEAAMEGGMHLLRHDAIEKVWSGALDLPGARAAST